MANKKMIFEALVANQSPSHQVLMIRATAKQIQQIASIERLGRDESGKASGFQRHQVASHIAEIRNYLENSDSVLPNALVLAFVGGANVKFGSNGTAKLEIDLSKDKPGFIVDGQQRLTALTLTERDDFQVFAACLICRDVAELRRQFILINNTKPLPKSLIYELLPGMDELPDRFAARTLASTITEQLNFNAKSSLKGLIKMQTYPAGILKDTSVQKLIMNSESSGAIQVLMHSKDGVDKAAKMVSNFFDAVKNTFPESWDGHTPNTSRLVHGAGIVAMGYVMDEVYSKNKSTTVDAFIDGIRPLVGSTAWTDGSWKFSDGEIVAWNHIENTPRQYHQLAEHLVGLIRRKTKVTSRQRGSAK
jgi:DGQHR domain-containing protein